MAGRAACVFLDTHTTSVAHLVATRRVDDNGALLPLTQRIPTYLEHLCPRAICRLHDERREATKPSPWEGIRQRLRASIEPYLLITDARVRASLRRRVRVERFRALGLRTSGHPSDVSTVSESSSNCHPSFCTCKLLRVRTESRQSCAAHARGLSE